jgi:quercetin dioxygenase-like cupin family protein/DNA-binding XRE family transcriptional regulator
MISDTLDRGLRAYHVGDKLRALRLRKKMGLVELGRHTGLSPAMISKLERGRLHPTLPTLLRISLVFGVGLDHFFAPQKPAYAVVRAKDRLVFPERLEGRDVVWEFESLDFAATDRRLSAYRVTFPEPPRRLRLHSHDDAELVHVLSGRLTVTVAGEPQTLDGGDSIYFDARQPHGYARASDRGCAAIVVTAPA